MHAIRESTNFVQRQKILTIPIAFSPIAFLLCALVGGGDTAVAGTPGPYKGPPRSLTISPQTFSVRVGASQDVIARNSGGEAMRFTTDWTIKEGAVGGALSAPFVDGYDSTVSYTAPSVPGGPFHIIASDHQDPTHYVAVATVTVTP